ncbi:prolyl oligopeptidase family serine peptidase [Phenylobacterium sp.]|uniref:alpha/beta hydrolase family protein n=1 Tax=Phenylobacterium sp. TaxID=1871053 RepID=UPI0025DE9BB9|nr:prolyl oligopeptidase family serine peptidase [Phenylobacterium sp.]
MTPDPTRRGLLLGSAAAGTCALLHPDTSVARPLILDDILAREALGVVSISPCERWFAVEVLGQYASAAHYDYDRFNDLFRTRLMVTPLSQPKALEPLFAPDPGVGYALGPFAPDGEHIAVFRLADGVWELGIASPTTRAVCWLNLTPDIPKRGRVVQWGRDGSLFAIAIEGGGTPPELRALRPQAGLTALHAAAARGGAAAVALGSGAYLGASRGGARRALVRIDAAGATKTLARGEFEDLEVSPDGGWIALLEAGPAIGLRPERPVQGSQGTETRRSRLRLARTAAVDLRDPCPDVDILPQLLRWSPNGMDLLVFGRDDGDPWMDGELLRINAALGSPHSVQTSGFQPLVEGRPATVRAGWWDGEPIAYGRREDGKVVWRRLGSRPLDLAPTLTALPRDGLVAEAEVVWIPTPEGFWRMGSNGVGHLERVAGKPVRPFAPGLTKRFQRGLQDGPPLVVRDGSSGQRLVALSRQRKTPPLVIPEAAELRAYAHGSGGAAVSVVRGGGRLQLVWCTQNRPPQVLCDINRGLESVARPRVHAVKHSGPEGQPLTSWLLLPSMGSPPASAPPLIVWPYPGLTMPTPPTSVDVASGGDVEEPALMVGQGYAVLLPSLPNPASPDGPAQGLAARVLAIVDTAARDPSLRGRFDPERLGMWGSSFGGYAVLAMAAQTDRFRVGIAKSSISDLFSQHGSLSSAQLVWPDGAPGSAWWAGWTEDLQGGMRDPPWASIERYARHSPTLQADHIHTPLLIVHGDLDSVPIGQSVEMFGALFRQGKDAQLVTYFGEGHGFLGPGNLRDYYGRAFRWLAEHLAPDLR